MRIKPNEESLIRVKGQGKKNQKVQYERTLSLANLVRMKLTIILKALFGIGNTVGAGIFALTGVAA